MQRRRAVPRRRLHAVLGKQPPGHPPRVSDDRWAQLIQQARALGVEQRPVRRPGLRGEQRQAMWRDAALLLAGTGRRPSRRFRAGGRRTRGSVGCGRGRAHRDHIAPGRPVFWSNPAPGPARWAQSCPSCSPTTLRRRGMSSSLVRVRAQRAARCWPAATVERINRISR